MSSPPGPFSAKDEGRHDPSSDRLWSESYYFDFAADDGSIGGYVRLGLYPNWNRAWYWACVVRPGEAPVMVVDNLAALPEPGTSSDIAIECPTYQAGQQFERPGECARLTLDSDVLGFSLSWRTREGVYPYSATTRYEVPCVVEGQVRVGADTRRFLGSGQRDHSWGPRDWWSISWLWTAGRLNDGTAFHGTQANLGQPTPLAGYTAVDGELIADPAGLVADSEFDQAGEVSSCRLSVGGLRIAVQPLATAPVKLISEEGERARFLRALCRFETSDSRYGYGWTEWHQPAGWRDHSWAGSTQPGPPQSRG